MSLAACSGGDSSGGSDLPCVQGSTQSCLCGDGESGVQSCVDERWASCECAAVDGPVFLSFGSNVTAIDETESVRFVAVLTDPDGIDDLIGGTLVDGDRSLGAFATSGQEGSYELVLTWDQINQSNSIAFEYGESSERSFVAEFYDVAGHTTKASATLSFACSEGWAACEGTCTDTMNDAEHCGSCSETPRCQGSCSAGWCGMECTSSAGGTCNAICAARGAVCNDSCSNSVYLYEDANCEIYDTLAGCSSPISAPGVACCCSQ